MILNANAMPQGFAAYTAASGLTLAGTGAVTHGDTTTLNNYNGDAALLSGFTSGSTIVNSLFNNSATDTTLTLINPLTVNSGNIATIQNLTITGSTLIPGNATANTEGIIMSEGGSVTINSVIGNSTASTGVSYVGWATSNFVLNAANTYTGNTNVSGSVVTVGNAWASQFATVNLANGTVNFAAGITTATFGGLNTTTGSGIVSRPRMPRPCPWP